jgi:hypothetical protein
MVNAPFSNKKYEVGKMPNELEDGDSIPFAGRMPKGEVCGSGKRAGAA